MLLIKDGRVIDPKSELDESLDLLIDGGRIAGMGKFPRSEEYETIIDAKGKIIAPGLVDVHVHFRDPGLTYKEDALYKLGYFIGSLGNLKALDVLPYHSMGKVKYEQLGIDYPLKDVEDLPREEAIKAKEIILRGLRDRRAEDAANNKKQ